MRYDIITIGDAFEDVFVLPTELKVRPDSSFDSGMGVSFELGDKIPLSEVDYEIGGSACNTSIGFKRLGLNPSLISIIGNDTPAEKIVQKLEDEDIDTSSLKVNKKMQTNFSVIFRMEQGRTIFIYHGLKDYSSLRIPKSIKTNWIFLAPTGDRAEDLEMDIIARVAEMECKLAWNPGVIQIQKGAGHYRSLLKNVSVLILNKEELIKFLGLPVRPQEDEAIKKLQFLGPKIVVVTAGKYGAKAYDGEHIYSISTLDKTVRVDSTGAGDSFAVGFLAKLILENWKTGEVTEGLMGEALRWGILNSNSVIQYVGAQKGLLTRDQIDAEEAKGRQLPIRIH